MSRYRIGTRNLVRSLDRQVGQHLDHYSTRMLGGASRPRPPNDLATVVRCLKMVVRIHKRMAKREPHLFDFALINRLQREAAEQQAFEAECKAAIDRVYGTPPEKLLTGKT